MNDNLIINDKNVARVLTVLKYVTLTFHGDLTVVKKQIPGEVINAPVVDAQKDPVSDYNENYNYYYLLYNWEKGGLPMSLLVPNIDTDYDAYWCSIKVPKSELQIVYSTYDQTQVGSYVINSQKPLYIRGETMDGSILRNVTINNNMTVASDNSYNLNLAFNINGASVAAGTSKIFDVKLSFYKDRICTKFIGLIYINIKLFNSTGPGE